MHNENGFALQSDEGGKTATSEGRSASVVWPEVGVSLRVGLSVREGDLVVLQWLAGRSVSKCPFFRTSTRQSRQRHHRLDSMIAAAHLDRDLRGTVRNVRSRRPDSTWWSRPEGIRARSIHLSAK